jgi:hypothetical protein
VLRGCSEDGNGEGGRACMPSHRDVIQILEDAHAKGVNRARVSRDQIEDNCVVPWAIRTTA